jgi:hypothetical protein
MSKSVFGEAFSSGKTSGAGRGTALSSDGRGRATRPEGDVDWQIGPATLGEQGWRYEEKRDRRRRAGQPEEEEEPYTYPTNAEDRARKDFEKSIEDRLKKDAEEERRKVEEERRKVEEERRKVEEERKRASKPVPDETSPPTPSPTPTAGTPPATTKELSDAEIKSRQEIARRVSLAVGAKNDEAISDLRDEAVMAGVTPEAYDKFVERERTRPTEEQLRTRQDVAARMKAALRSDDPTALEAAFEDAVGSGVSVEAAHRFLNREKKALAQRSEIRAGTLLGEPSNLDAYYGAQTEKSRGIPVGYRSGKSRPVAPDWRIHTRLYRLVNKPYSDRPGAGTRLSPEAASMLYEQKTGRKLAFDRPIEFIQQQQERRAKAQEALEEGVPPLFNSPFGRG